MAANAAAKKLAEDEEDPLSLEELAALAEVCPTCEPKERYDDQLEGYI